MDPNKMFPRTVKLRSIGLHVPLTPTETFLAFDDNQQLWAYSALPLWSPASQKWIPVGDDCPRHIITWKGDQVNAFLSIESFPVN